MKQLSLLISVIIFSHFSYSFELEERRYFRGYDITLNKNQDQNGYLFRIYFNDVRDLPQKFYDGIKAIIPRRSGKIPVAIMLTVTNDFNVLKVFGLQFDTDDFGYTHGSQLSIIGSLPDGKTLTFDYSTDLYTQPVQGTMVQLPDGGRRVQQYFTDENIFRLILSNKMNNRLFYWRAELGWQELNSQIRGNYRYGSNQQLHFHDFVNQINVGQTKSFVNLENGKPFRNGPLVGIYYGFHKTILNYYQHCEVNTEIEFGHRESSLHGADLNLLKFELINSCLTNSMKNQYQLVIGSEVIEHELGTQSKNYFDLSWSSKKWKIGFIFELPQGDLINYQDYNILNIENDQVDPIFKVYLQRRLN